MKKIKVFSIFLLFLNSFSSLFSQQFKPPHLEKGADAIQLIVKDKPFLSLAGELHNSTVSAADYMRPVWSQMKKKNLNTVLAPVYWEVIEPQEAKFDFSLVDSMIDGARKQNLHLGILWFGAFKTTYSMYTPSWIKNNAGKYPRAKNKMGEALPMLSVFSETNLKADAKAFKTLMQHIRQVDEKYQTVIMAQVENEVGIFGGPRDYSDEANQAYNNGVPADLMKYLIGNKGKLQPEIDSAWKANGYKTSGSWEDVFGKSVSDEKNPKVFSYLPEELFSVYHYSKFVGQLAEAGKEAYPVPMFVNAWPKAAMFGWPGKYPSGGPVAYTLDIWRANAPAIDVLTPNVYAPKQGALYLIEQYRRSGNPVLLPEFRKDEDAANFALFVYGKYDAICFSPFGIDDSAPEEDPFTKTYAALSQVQHLVLQHQGKGTMMGVFVDTTDKSQTFNMNGYAVKADLVVPRGFPGAAAPAGKKAAMAGGIVFAIGPDEFIAIGKDYDLTFTPLKANAGEQQVDVDFMYEGMFVNSKWVTTRRLNGDEGTGGGDIGGFGIRNTKVGTLRFHKNATDDYSIVRIKFYRY